MKQWQIYIFIPALTLTSSVWMHFKDLWEMCIDKVAYNKEENVMSTFLCVVLLEGQGR